MFIFSNFIKKAFGILKNCAFEILADIYFTVALFVLADNCVYAP